MADQPSPAGLTGAAGQVVDALKASPVILLIVLLNMAFAGSAGWYLAKVEDKRSDVMRLILERCIAPPPPMR